MKMVVEFNSNQEVLEFIQMFGAGAVQLVPAKKEESKEKIDTKKSEPKKEETKKAEEPKKEDKNQEVKVTKEMLRTNFSSLVKKGKNATAKNLMEKYGASKLMEVKEEDYEALNKDLLEAIRG